MDPVPLASVDATALRWLRIGERPLRFELRAGDALLARLEWQKDSGSLAVATGAEGAWQLKRSGFLNPHVTVRRAGESVPVARLSVHLNYHAIDIAGGPSFRFHRAGVLLPAWKVTAADGREVLHVEPVREGRVLAGGAVLASAESSRSAPFLLLVVLSWYFIALAWFEDETVVPLERAALSVAPQP
jgi:hypothetical protein